VTNADPAKSRAGQRSPLRVAGNKRTRAITGEIEGGSTTGEGGRESLVREARGERAGMGRNGGKKNLVFVTLTYLR